MPYKVFPRAAATMFVFMFLLSLPLFAQWQQMGLINAGGKANTIERVGTDLWAGTDLGIYTSSNEGLTWERSTNFQNKLVVKIENYNDTILVFFKNRPDEISNPNNDILYSQTSFNAGLTWGNVVRVEIDFVDYWFELIEVKRYGNWIILFGLNTAYFSQNFGLTWNVYLQDMGIINGLACFDEGGFLYSQYNSINQNYDYTYRQVVGGGINALNTEGHPTEQFAGKIDDAIFTVCRDAITLEPYLIRTFNWGSSWDTIPGVQLSTFASNWKFRLFNDTLYCIDSNSSNTIKITDGGNTVGLGLLSDFHAELFGVPYNANSSSSRFDYTHTNDGKYLTTNRLFSASPFKLFDENLSFVSHYGSGINTTRISTFKKIGSRIALSANDITYFSDTTLAEWDTLNNAKRINGFTQGDSIFYVIEGSSGNYLRRSYNGGASFTNVNCSATVNSSIQDYGSELSINSINNTLYLEGGNALFRSLNWGTNWLSMPGWTTQFGPVSYFGSPKGSIYKYNGEVLLAVTSKPLVLKLDPSNNTWSFFGGYSEQQNGSFHRLIHFDSTLFSLSSQHFMFSNNEGQNWDFPAMNGLPLRENVGKIYPTSILIDSTIWYGAFQEFGVYYSSDQGNNWIPIDATAPFTVTGDLFLKDDTLFAASINGGMWKRKIDLISGTVYNDLNASGTQDPGEIGIPNIPVKSLTDQRITLTNADGVYTRILSVPQDSLEVILDLHYITIPTNPQEIIPTQSVYDFGVLLQPYNDLSVSLTALNVFRPGFNTYLQLSGQNRGSEISNATLKLLLPEFISITNSLPPISAQSGDTLIWNTPDLDFFEQFTIQLTTYTAVNAPFGDSVFCYAHIDPTYTDSLPENNTFIWEDIVVGSYDPNDKRCIQGEEVLIENINEHFELQYVIRFQNTGTYEAENVWIADQLSPLLDWSSLRIIDQSHEPLQTEVDGNGLLRFYFNHIQLPDSFSNEPLSHGFVKYSIKPRQEIVVGNIISNTAGIYFDFNEPVITNTVHTEITQPIHNTGTSFINSTKNKLFVHPNPTNSSIVLSADHLENQPVWLAIFDALGRKVVQAQLTDCRNPISVNTFAPGVYLIILMNTNGEKLGDCRFVKE